MTAFMQIAEVWMVNGDRLALHSGAYGGHNNFREVSTRARFARGEGLPGSVWSSRKPQVWDTLEESDFVRLPAAREVGIEAGVGIPVCAGGSRSPSAVVTLLCGSRTQTGGCIERWDVNPDTRELTHAGGYYGKLDKFARMSPNMRFQAGHGLPGMALQRRLPTIIEDTRRSDSFMRADLARESGIEAGVAFPVIRDGEVAHVIVMLSTEATPLARAFEVWTPTQLGRLRLDQAFYSAGLEGFAEMSRNTEAKVGHGLAGRAFRTELPHVYNALGAPPFVRHEAAKEARLSVGIAIPVVDGPRVTAVLLLLS